RGQCDRSPPGRGHLASNAVLPTTSMAHQSGCNNINGTSIRLAGVGRRAKRPARLRGRRDREAGGTEKPAGPRSRRDREAGGTEKPAEPRSQQAEKPAGQETSRPRGRRVRDDGTDPAGPPGSAGGSRQRPTVALARRRG